MFDKFGKGIISWGDLGGIFKALGFPEPSSGLLIRAKIESNPSNTAGLDNKELQKLLHSEEMNQALDYTFNKHNSTYNIRVIKKAIQILVASALTIEELREARMSFLLYEGELSAGILLDEKAVLTTLKVTRKAISSKKLREWLNQLSPDVPGRIQLYEFFDLFRNCENKETVRKQLHNPAKSIEKGKTGLYELTDSSFLLTPEAKLLKKMDDDYDVAANMLPLQQPSNLQKRTKEQTKQSSGRGGTMRPRVEMLQESYSQIRSAITETSEKATRAKGSLRVTQTVDPAKKDKWKALQREYRREDGFDFQYAQDEQFADATPRSDRPAEDVFPELGQSVGVKARTNLLPVPNAKR
eukprot:TRINITY_DN3362_c0_g1_i3.p1 TRINITY_DN3362_c0_g1~~TRINITY_DN3362_c0_g1_i3.p1  ORF type:complete len:400 (-),score=73.22 TRINITY_DN3362_c0_g1_i3:294-1358(-)